MGKSAALISEQIVEQQSFNDGAALSDVSLSEDHTISEVESIAASDAPLQPNKNLEKRYFGFLRSKTFWIVLVHGQILSLSITCTNTLTTEMSMEGNNIPAFQSLFTYALLFLIFLPYTIYQMGFKAFWKMFIRDCWKFFILGFADVQGNYFVVKAYQYTNILSAALLDNFAIVVVVILSFVLLKVRYHWSQYLGTIIAIGGMALLVVSDHLTHGGDKAANPVKGDLFVLLGAACYGISNTLEEYFVSKRPMYQVLGMLGLFGMFIIGVQAAIFERDSIQQAHWNGKVGGYLTGFTLTMLLIYTTAPILFRMSSAAFYNLSLLTSDFWSLLVGIEAFGYYVYWLYPVGFVFTVLGVICYCAAPMTKFGESFKPWLGEDQEKGIAGLGTAKARLNRSAAAAEDDNATAASSSEGSDIEVTSANDTDVENADELVQSKAH